MLDQVRSLEGKVVRHPFRLRRRPEDRVIIFGQAMDLMKPVEVFHFAAERIAAGRKTVVANHNLHSLHLLPRSDELRAFYRRADLVEVDSVPLIAWARLTSRRGRRFHRCTYLDWRDEFWTFAEQNGWKVFFLGGAPGVFETAAEAIRARHPGVRLEGRHGEFDMTPGSEGAEAAIAAVRAAAPHVLFVGMGMPRQEIWVERNYDALPACAVFTVGGAFDYEAGVQTPCPRWLGQVGLEWAFRLLTNPRLTRRYLVEPWTLVGPALLDLLRPGRSAARRCGRLTARLTAARRQTGSGHFRR